MTYAETHQEELGVKATGATAPAKKSDSGNLGAMIGGASGGGVVLLGAIAAAVMCMRKKNPAPQPSSVMTAVATTVVVEATQPSVQIHT